MNKSKKTSSKILSLIMSVVLIITMLPVMQVSAAVVKFPLKTNDGTLVADDTTSYITLFEQDPISKMITATVQIKQGGAEIAIDILGVAIYFDKTRVAPYSYKSSQPAVFDKTRIDPTTNKEDIGDLFAPYYKDLAGFTLESNQIIDREGSNEFISIMLNRPTTEKGLPDPIKIKSGTTDIAKFYFMPLNESDKILDLNMFYYDYKRDDDTFIRASNFIGNGSCYLEVTTSGVRASSGTYVINADSFKLHVQHIPPIVKADNENRLIEGYNSDTMEWKYAEDTDFRSDSPVVKDETHIIHVRLKGGEYTNVGKNSYYAADYIKYVAGASAVADFSASSCRDKIELTKTSVNESTTDGKTHVGNDIVYTITVKNTASHPSSVWADAEMTDVLPEGLDFKGEVTLNGVTLDTPDGYTFENGTLTVSLGNIQGGETKIVTFKATVSSDAHGKDITNHVSVVGKDGEDGEEFIEETDEEGDKHVVVDKSASPTLDPITEGDRTITGKGKPGSTIKVRFPNDRIVEVTIPGGAGDDAPWSVNVPDDVNLIEGNKVTATQVEENKDPSDPAEAIVSARPTEVKGASKTAKNITTNDDSIRHVGDKLLYTITATNSGPAKSLWANVIVVDELPSEVDFLAGTLKIDQVTVSDTDKYNAATRTLTVDLGGILGGTSKVVTFEVEINKTAYEKTFKNSATVGGEYTEEPEDPPAVVRRSKQPTVYEINEGDRTIEGKGEIGAKIEISFQASTLIVTTYVGANGEWSIDVPKSINLFEGDEVTAVQTENGFDPSEPLVVTVQAMRNINPYLSKTSKNMSSEDGRIHVNDRIEYTIIVGNSKQKSTWNAAKLTDVLPDGVAFTPGTVKIDGVAVPVGNYTYTDGVLTVTLGDIAGGTEKVVTFEVTVKPDAYDKDIRNSASVTGKENGGPDITEETEEEGDDYTVVSKSDEPIVNEITRGDETITGTGVPGADIIVKLPDGTEIKTKVDEEDGTWTADLPAGKEVTTDDEVIVIQIEDDKDPSHPVEVIVKDKQYRAVHGYVYPIVFDDNKAFAEAHEIIVELRVNANTPAIVLKTIAVATPTSWEDEIGEFTIENVPFGEYVLYIKRPGYIARHLPVNVTKYNLDMIELAPPPTDLKEEGIFKLWSGDSNNDLRVDGKDFAMITAKLNVAWGSPNYDPALDLNADGRIDGKDISMATSNVNVHARNYAGGQKVDYDAEPIE